MSKYRKSTTQNKNRREFIKLGTAGIVGSLAACSSTPPAAPSQGSEPSADVPDRGFSENPPSPPSADGLIDPARLRNETWQEPWTWRPQDWPGESLELNVVGRQSLGDSPSSGNPNPSLFSFNGTSPGPTIRVRSDGELKLKLRNLLGFNHGKAAVGHVPDPFELPPDIAREICALVSPAQGPGGEPADCFIPNEPEAFQQVTGFETRDNWDIGGHINGVHSAHTTNIHTHGLHVHPGSNGDGSHSDNVFLRVIPRADHAARLEKHGEDADVLLHDELVARADYRYSLSFERDGKRIPHPPGTHWYHPHAHGSTHDQVASGMAGYLIVEGDVDEAINRRLTGTAWPDPGIPSGPHDYRERLVFLQRAVTQSVDNAASPKKSALRFPPVGREDEASEPQVFRMRPGAIERWRVLNGSVDGAGTKRFMVLEGQFVQVNQRIWRVSEIGSEADRQRRLEPVTEAELEAAKVDLHLLAFDGITLVREKGGKARHWIKPLAVQNAGTDNPMASPRRAGENEMTHWLRAYESVWKDGDSLRRSFVRPNEVYLTNGNRADLFFRAPRDAAGKVFTIFAKEAHIHNDNMQQRAQGRLTNQRFVVFRDLFDVVAGYVHVTGEPVEGADFNIRDLERVLPEVPALLQPVHASELAIPDAEARVTGAPSGALRTRTIGYSGSGGTHFPMHPVPADYMGQHPELERLTWSIYEDQPILIQPVRGTMGINPEFDLARHPEPGPPVKFSRHHADHSRVLVDTAEEWVVYNNSMMLWAHTDRERFPQPGSYNFRHVSYPLTRAEGQRRYADDPEFRITNKATDHPFHIHVNPMWVLRIDVPDENGQLHNILPEPTWMDTVAVPRNGGRVVFRSRFDDFVGTWVHHCHILLHEDNGMMAAVECTDDASAANYQTRRKTAEHAMSGPEVDAIYPPPSLETMYRQNLMFVDPSDVGAHEFPGFEFDVPRLDET
jgi:FtsP/CotA-like multicopper oxidase with cupredoxin domain